MNTQYKKGVIELCVLSMLMRDDCYGYEISDFLSSRIGIAEGTVYPVLRKLKSDGLVTTYLSEDSGGPPRKYYTLTQHGKARYESGKYEYTRFAEGVKAILEENDE